MGTATTKHDLVKRVAAETQQPRNVVKQVTQSFLDGIIEELANGNRLEFRDFGVFEVVTRRPRVARNPRTGEAIHVPSKTVVNFKQGRVMRTRVAAYGEARQGTGAPAVRQAHDGRVLSPSKGAPAESAPRRPDNVVDPTGPRRPDNVVDPTGREDESEGWSSEKADAGGPRTSANSVESQDQPSREKTSETGQVLSPDPAPGASGPPARFD